MEEEDIAPNTVHKADPVGMGRKLRASTQYSSIVCRHDFLSIPTGSAVMYLAQCPRLPFCCSILYTTYYSMAFS